MFDDLFRHRKAYSRSITAENPDGAAAGGGRATPETTLHAPSAGYARDLGTGWKLSPCRPVPAGRTVTIMDHEGPGIVRHIWCTLDPKHYRTVHLTVRWDDDEAAAIDCPIGDLFCCAWNDAADIVGVAVNVNPKGGLNLFLPMPFRRRAHISVTNAGHEDVTHFFYQIDFTLESVPADAALLHAVFHHVERVPHAEPYTILHRVEGAGHYVGAFMAWEQRSPGWWGEGELKVYLDGDSDHPTICGTGTEDYFGGAWCFGRSYSAPYMGYRLVAGTENEPGCRHAMYRFHMPDPIFFHEDIRVTVQALGWQSHPDGAKYLPLQDEISSVAWWYQLP